MSFLKACAECCFQDWPHGYWVPDMRMPCYHGWHKVLAILVGLPMMAVTWLIIPLLPAFLLFLHRGKLDEPLVKLQFGYIYQCYRSDCQHHIRNACLLVSNANNCQCCMTAIILNHSLRLVGTLHRSVTMLYCISYWPLMVVSCSSGPQVLSELC